MYLRDKCIVTRETTKSALKKGRDLIRRGYDKGKPAAAYLIHSFGTPQCRALREI